LFTSENNDIANQSIDTSFFTSEKNRMTNQLASLARRDCFYLDAFWRVNLGMYIIKNNIQIEGKALYCTRLLYFVTTFFLFSNCSYDCTRYKKGN